MAEVSDIPFITLSELSDLLKNETALDFLIIDVRGKEDHKAGSIPNSHSLPIDKLESALKLEPEQFKSKYGFEKPYPEQKIIFSCQKGMRAQKAFNIASSFGYTGMRVYKGGFSEFSEKCKDKVVSA